MTAQRSSEEKGSRRNLVIRVSGLTARIPTGGCQWCTDEAVCSVCHSRANRARASLARTAAKRDSGRVV